MSFTNSIPRGFFTRFTIANLGLDSRRCLLVCAIGWGASTGWAADDNPRAPRAGGDLQQKLLEKFDADKNGRLDEAERAKAQEAMAQLRRGAGAPGAPGIDRRELTKRFDKDGDGKLDEAERAAAQAEFARLRGNAAGRPGVRPEGARPGGEFLKRFDKDGDGKLDEAERAAAKAAFAGRPGADRRAAGDVAPAAAKPDKGRVDKGALLKEFDTDGDGKLTGEERAAARRAYEQRKPEEESKAEAKQEKADAKQE